MLAPCVFVFNDYCIPLRHIVSLKGSYNAAEFKRWYYEQYDKLDADQFVYCETPEEQVDLQTNLKKAQAYHLIAPVWAEMENTDKEIQDIPANMIRADGLLEKAMEEYVQNHPFCADDTKNSHVFHVYPRIIKQDEVPYLDMILWLNQDDLPEREWNRLFDQLSDCLLNGWGKKFTDESIADEKGNQLWLHFGEMENDRVEFSVQM